MIEVLVSVLCLAGTILVAIAAKVIMDLGNAAKRIESKAISVMDEAHDLMQSAKPAIDAAPRLIENAGDAAEVATSVLEDASVVTGHVASAADKIADVAKIPSNIAQKAHEHLHAQE